VSDEYTLQIALFVLERPFSFQMNLYKGKDINYVANSCNEDTIKMVQQTLHCLLVVI
jgi:hypothetical protein